MSKPLNYRQMGKLISFEIKGMQALVKAANDVSKSTVKAIDDELNATALEIQAKAKQYAPVYDGQIRNSIELDTKYLDKKVNVLARHAAYVEFGTKRKVSVPAEWKDYAIQFKGRGDGGTWKDMLKALTDWVRKKGLAGSYRFVNARDTSKRLKRPVRDGTKSEQNNQDEQVAYAIMVSILKNGIKAQPYLYPAFKEGIAGLPGRIEKILQDEVNKL